MKKDKENILKKIQIAKIKKLRIYNQKKQIKLLNENSFKKEKKIQRPNKIHINRWNKSFFITGGIGDILAVECFLTDIEKSNVETIYYATRKKQQIENLFKSNKSFYNLKNHINLWEEHNNFWCFYSIEDYLKKTKNNKLINYKNCKDLSIIKIFDEINKKNIKYNKSSFLENKLCNIDKFNLPKNYIVILPYSTDKRISDRDFNNVDWDNTIKILEKFKTKGVLIGEEKNKKIPNNNFFINLINKTSIEEPIEILKKSQGYLGIDSWLSVLAPKFLDVNNIQIKSNNEHCYNNAHCYFSPLNKFDFLVNNVNYPTPKYM